LNSAREAEKKWPIVELAVERNSAREAVKIGPERVKLKNLHC
jgi:hypothetical protein